MGKKLNIIKINGYKKFNLEDTFECGQCFRWDKEDSKYHGVVKDKDVFVYYEEEQLIIEGDKEGKEDFWIKYFDLKRDYDNIRDKLASIDPFLKEACDFCPEIRILNQEPWETLCSFIISQNNNIPRIKGIIFRLCEAFGKEVGKNSFSFPKPEVIAKLSEIDLECIKSGFRAKYIIDAAKKVVNNEINLNALKNVPIQTARESLMNIKGVGPKVAECTLLYGLHRMEAFPLDVWMKRVMGEHFQGKKPEIFGDYAGLAQQYLFHYTRTKKLK